MTGEFDNNNTFGMTEEMQQTLARMKERLDAEDAEKKRNAERTAKYDELKKNENYSVFQKGGIDEMIQKNPAILDSDTAMQMALENSLTKVKLMEAESKAAQPQTPPQENINTPANPTGANVPPQSDKSPLSSQQFMDKMAAGTATLDDLERVPKNQLNPFVRYQAKKAIANRRGNIEETIAKGRAALGSNE